MRLLLATGISLGALIVGAQPAAAAPPPWYPPLRWLPAADGNFDVGRGGSAIARIVVHATAGRYAGTLAWFRNGRAALSAHYVIRASDGEITQMVAEKDTAFHARGSNRDSIGIEHEWDPASGIRFTDAMYRSSATLVCAIARRYRFVPDRAHVVGHAEVDGADHVDPGPSWDWSYYMRLVRACSDAADLPPAGLSIGASGAAVTQLQTALARLGYTSYVTGYFGPITERAVRRFQLDHGIDPIGVYGPRTRAAMAQHGP